MVSPTGDSIPKAPSPRKKRKKGTSPTKKKVAGAAAAAGATADQGTSSPATPQSLSAGSVPTTPDPTGKAVKKKKKITTKPKTPTTSKPGTAAAVAAGTAAAAVNGVGSSVAGQSPTTAAATDVPQSDAHDAEAPAQRVGTEAAPLTSTPVSNPELRSKPDESEDEGSHTSNVDVQAQAIVATKTEVAELIRAPAPPAVPETAPEVMATAADVAHTALAASGASGEAPAQSPDGDTGASEPAVTQGDGSEPHTRHGVMSDDKPGIATLLLAPHAPPIKIRRNQNTALPTGTVSARAWHSGIWPAPAS